MYTFLSYSDLKNDFDYAIHMRKARKSRFLMKFCLHFFVCSCRWNSKTLKCREILHFQKHSSLHNRFWKRTMFFVFSFFHFLCKLIISTSTLSVDKKEIWRNFQYNIFSDIGLISVPCSVDANFAFKYHVYLISINFIHLFFYFHSYIFSILTQVDTLNGGFVGALS